MKLKNRIIFISGGTSGIGLEFARQLSRLGNKIIISGTNGDKIDAVSKQYPQFDVIYMDVTDPNSIRDTTNWLRENYTGIDIVINCAGLMRRLDFTNSELSLEEATIEVDTNLRGTIQLSLSLLPILKKQEESMLVNVTSGLAWVPTSNIPVYSGTKSAVHFFTRSLKKQLKGTNVHVLELAPPQTKTELMGKETAESKTAMDPVLLVTKGIKGMEKNKALNLPGMSSILRPLGSYFPNASHKLMDRLVH